MAETAAGMVMDEAGYGSIGAPARRRKGPFLALLLLVVAAFAGGAVLAVIVAQRVPRVAQVLHLGTAPVSAPVVVPLRPAPQPVAAPDTTVLEERVAGLEQEVARVDQRTVAATGNADRAEGLLIAFAARRALDRGMGLGYIEGLLRERFGGSDPQAVAAVIAAARQPITLDQLQNGLEALRPKLTVASAREDWWSAFRHQLGSLIVVRPADTPSAIPADRVQRAVRALEAGQVDHAMSEVGRLPGRAAATDWLVEARRYVQARLALDRIETSALLRPHAAMQPEMINTDPTTSDVPAT